MTSCFLSRQAAYDEGYAEAANQIPIWQAFGQNWTNGIADDRAFVEGYVSYFSAEDQAWVRAECWATKSYARGLTDKVPAMWGVNEMPILTVLS